MEAFLVSTGIVALAEMGDKTQLLSLVLAARFRKPWPIVAGILVATLANHALAGALGTWVTTLLGPDVLRWVLGVSFLAMAAWMLIPDQLDEGDDDGKAPRLGIFGTTVLAFFLAEMGDKTQIATVMLAAQYQAWIWVVAGTTLGMMLANAPVVWFGERITRMLPIRVVHMVSAGVFCVLGILALLGWAEPASQWRRGDVRRCFSLLGFILAASADLLQLAGAGTMVFRKPAKEGIRNPVPPLWRHRVFLF
jgi:putative Ca2+/H+ antiporter (TMEM165/GDT1 family)